jgi:hypothetical protein
MENSNLREKSSSYKNIEKLRNLGMKSSSHRDTREIQTWEIN